MYEYVMIYVMKVRLIMTDEQKQTVSTLVVEFINEVCTDCNDRPPYDDNNDGVHPTDVRHAKCKACPCGMSVRNAIMLTK